MDESYRADSPHIHPADLDSTWMRGESGQGCKTKPQPLNTARLKVFRQVTRGAILSILETGHVSVEFVRKKGDQDRLTELLVISADGQEICIEQWKNEAGSIDGDMLCPGGNIERTWKTFTWAALPERYWKKYAYACRFVELVKSKTAKVTMYSEKAKGVLMENWPPSFEANFFHGPRIVLCGNEVHIREESGASLLFHRDSFHSLVNAYTLDLVQHAMQMREQCVRLEASVMTVQAMSHNTEPLFPVTVGMRPSTSFCSSTSSNSGSVDLLSSPRFSLLPPSPSPASPGLPASPPASPGPHIDLRCIEPSRSSAPMDGMTPQSPFRHISTLEGRKYRRQTSDSTDCSNSSDGNTRQATQTIPDLCQNSPYRQEPVSSNHGFVNTFPGMDTEHIQHISSPKKPFMVPAPTASSPHKTPIFSTPQHNHIPRNSNGQSTNTLSSNVEQGKHNYKSDLKGQSTNFISSDAKQGRQHTTENMPFNSVKESSTEKSSPAWRPQTHPMSPGGEKQGGRECEEQSAVVRQAFVAYTGWASQLANGAIWIRYNDGTQLGVYRDQPEVVYVDQQGNKHRYLQSDNIPEVVRQKLEKLPIVIESLKKRPSVSPHSPTSI